MMDMFCGRRRVNMGYCQKLVADVPEDKMCVQPLRA